MFGQYLLMPLAGLSVLYWFGKLEKRKLAYLIIFALPLLQIIGIGSFQAIRVAGRFNDNDFTARVIQGNGVKLQWAPQGTGWPDNGTSWNEAKRICAHLWNMHLKTIYWWTSTVVNREKAYIIAYNGGVWPRMKKLKAAYLNFRAVKEVK
jgi:hypothetical protein